MIIYSLALSVLPLISCFLLEVFRGIAAGVPDVSVRLYEANPLRLWPNSTIYYDVDPYMRTNRFMLTSVQKAVEYLNSLTCFKWIQRYPWQDLPHVVTFLMYEDTFDTYLCGTDVGFLNEPQHIVYLGRNCYVRLRKSYEADGLVDKYFLYPVLHAMVHVMGLDHEHQRPDRDCYIWVADSVPAREGWKPDFDSDLKFDFPYDYNSITHYSEAYSVVHPHDPKYGLTVGRSNGTLSDLDVWKLERMYCSRLGYCNAFRQECRAIVSANKQNPNCTRFGDNPFTQ